MSGRDRRLRWSRPNSGPASPGGGQQGGQQGGQRVASRGESESEEEEDSSSTPLSPDGGSLPAHTKISPIPISTSPNPNLHCAPNPMHATTPGLKHTIGVNQMGLPIISF